MSGIRIFSLPMSAFRREDEERLRLPHGTKDPSLAFPQALGILVEAPRELASDILKDLDSDILGVRWWATHLPMAHRVLIADHLYLCVSSIQVNMVEARLHLLEARAAAEERDRLLAGALTVDAGGKPQFRPPRPTCPADDVVSARVDMHIVGCVRALASALDCVGAAIVGVLALPTPLFKSSYKSARTAILEREKKGGHEIQRTYGRQILTRVDAAGPKGWDEWVLEFRNMLVHRGRRTWMRNLRPSGVRIFIPGGGAVFPSPVIPMLPSDPGRSEIEVLRDASEEKLVLREDGWHTLEAAIESTNFTVHGCAELLLDAWRRRRADPDALPQPKSQWPHPKSQSAPFDGYAPGSVPFDPTEIHANSVFGKRIKAAAVEDASRTRWNE